MRRKVHQRVRELGMHDCEIERVIIKWLGLSYPSDWHFHIPVTGTALASANATSTVYIKLCSNSITSPPAVEALSTIILHRNTQDSHVISSPC